MDLHPYLLSLTEQEREAFAKACKTTQNYLWNIARSFSKPPPACKRASPKLASLIEAASNKKVRRWESNPEDWHITWPELVGSPGAPTPQIGDVAEVNGCVPALGD